MNIPSQNIFLGLILTFTTVHKILYIIFFTYGSQYVFYIYNSSQNSLINFSLKIFFKVDNDSQWYTYIIVNHCEQKNNSSPRNVINRQEKRKMTAKGIKVNLKKVKP